MTENDEGQSSSIIPQPPADDLEPIVEAVEIKTLATDWALFSRSRRLLVPRPLFLGLVGALTLSLGLVAWLAYTLQTESHLDQELAMLAVIEATGTGRSAGHGHGAVRKSYRHHYI